MLKKCLSAFLVVSLVLCLTGFSAFALKKGDQGTEVKKLQKRLIKLGYYKITTLTGVYSDEEVDAIMSFQSDNGLEPTGIADDATIELLYSNKTKRASKASQNGFGSIVATNPVGSETKELSFEVVDKCLEVWKDSNGNNEVFAFVAIKNTDNKYIYMDNCQFDYEDNDGHIVDTATMVCSCPYVIAPDEVGYFYVSGVNGGFLDDNVDISKGIKLVAQFSLEKAREAVVPYEVFDDKLEYEDTFGNPTPIVKGRIKNDSDEDESLLYINVIYKDKKGNVIAIDGTNIMDLYAGSTMGFEIASMFSISPRLRKDNIGSYEIIACPIYYQY